MNQMQELKKNPCILGLKVLALDEFQRHDSLIQFSERIKFLKVLPATREEIKGKQMKISEVTSNPVKIFHNYMEHLAGTI